MKTKRHILETLAALLALGFVFALVLQRGGTASAYPPPPTPTQGVGLPNYAYSIYVPVMSRIVAPPFTTSLYMTTTDPTMLYNLGRTYGTAGTAGIAILDFGQAYNSGTSYGTRLFDPNLTFVSTSSIESGADQFLLGWWSGYFNNGGAGIAPSAQITLALGTSNCGPAHLGDSADCMPGGDAFYGAQARAWAQMAINVRSFINSPPSYASKEFVVAANDIEPGFNYSTTTRTWVDNYTNYFGSVMTTTIRMYNYGSCDSCAYVLPDGTGCPSCIPSFTQVFSGGTQVRWSWTNTDVRYTLWQAPPAWPLVENYLTNTVQAYQWHQLGVFSYDNFGGNKIRYQGTLTQHQFCQHAACGGTVTDNPPADGWLQLWAALDGDPKTQLDGGADMLYSSDIKKGP